MMRRALALGATLTLLLGLVSSAPAQTRELVMGNVNPPKHGTSQAAQQFADKLAEITQGKVKVVHHHSGTLGGEREVAQNIQLGTVDLGPITTAPLSTLVPEMSVFQLPYIFRDYQHVYAALDGADVIRKYYEGVLHKKGFHLVGFIAAGYRGIYGHHPINGLADVKGKKIRVQEDKILVATFKSLGMISTPIAFPEVATALQTKVIDFAEGGINTFYHNKFYDIVKHVADVRHTHQAVAFIMAMSTWQKLDAPTQKAVGEAWEHARQFNRKFILDEDASIQDQVKARGVAITKPDATPFRQATKNVYDEFFASPAGKDARKIVDHILSIK
jgi:tripartite ATP-independent transporter DctP family solute receptor